MEDFLYFFMGLGTGRIPVTEMVLEIKSVIKRISSRRDLTVCFMEKKKTMPPLKAKGNKEIIQNSHISSDANSKSRKLFPVGKSGYLSEGDSAKLNWTGN